MSRNETVEEHYRQNYKRLVNHVANRVPNKSHALAEEVVQEAYARALRYYEGFDETRRPFPTWFNRILNNSCTACIQAEGGGPMEYVDEYEMEPFQLMKDQSVPFEVVVRIEEAIKKEPVDRQEILNMFFNLGMKTREISECVEFSHSNIRQIISRFRIRFNDNGG